MDKYTYYTERFNEIHKQIFGSKSRRKIQVKENKLTIFIRVMLNMQKFLVTILMHIEGKICQRIDFASLILKTFQDTYIYILRNRVKDDYEIEKF